MKGSLLPTPCFSDLPTNHLDILLKCRFIRAWAKSEILPQTFRSV